MMFSAGMGIGLMFYGVAEPLAHFASPPPGTAAPGTPEAFDMAMATTLFHWTLHPWAIYAVVGLAIAYGTFRRGRPQLLSSAFIPLFGRKRAEGGFGKAVDILAIFATLFGSAASLGLGALQIGGGLMAGGFMSSVSTTLLVVIIVTLTICFILSAVSGVSKGVQWLSNINMVLAGDPGSRRVRRRTDRADPQPAAHRHRRLLQRPRPDGRPHRGHRRRRHRDLARRLDGLLLGLVDLLDAVRRHVHRPDQPRPHDPSVHRRASSSSRAR